MPPVDRPWSAQDWDQWERWKAEQSTEQDQIPLGGIEHRCDLIEEHRITIPQHLIPDGVDAVAVCRIWAEAWADAYGLELRAWDMTPVAASSTQPGSAFTGVRFTVHVGRGEISLDTVDTARLGHFDKWKWSARMEHWRRVLTNNDGRKGKLLARPEDQRRNGGGGGGSNVVPLHGRSPFNGPSFVDPSEPKPAEEVPLPPRSGFVRGMVTNGGGGGSGGSVSTPWVPVREVPRQGFGTLGTPIVDDAVPPFGQSLDDDGDDDD